jgi:hypothetical protein
LKNGLLVIAVAVYAVLSIGAAYRAPGSVAVSLSFLAIYGALLFLAFPKPRLYVYTCTAIFLFLGFAVKFIALQMFEVRLNEPIGAFSHTLSNNAAARRDRARDSSSRLIQSAYARRGPAAAPDFYVRYRAAIWILATIAFVGIAVLNITDSFYQIGLDTQMILPMRLHIIASWLVHSGFILVTALLVAWEMSLQRSSAALAAPAVEGLLISISALSRSLFMLHVMPFALWMLGHDEERPPVRIPRWYTAYATMFAASIIGVMVARAIIYPPRKVQAPEIMVAAKTLPAKPASPAPVTPVLPPATTTQVAATKAPATKPKTTKTSPSKTGAGGDSDRRATNDGWEAARHRRRQRCRRRRPALVNASACASRRIAWKSSAIIGRWIGLEGTVAVAAHESRSPAMLMHVVKKIPPAERSRRINASRTPCTSPTIDSHSSPWPASSACCRSPAHGSSSSPGRWNRDHPGGDRAVRNPRAARPARGRSRRRHAELDLPDELPYLSLIPPIEQVASPSPRWESC